MKRITHVEVKCSKCWWFGVVGECDIGEDGDLLCPECKAMVIETEEK